MKDKELIIYFDFIGTFGGAQQSTATLLNMLLEKSDKYRPLFLSIPGTDSRFLSALRIDKYSLVKSLSPNVFDARSNKVVVFFSFIKIIISIFCFVKKQKGKVSIMSNSPKALFVTAPVKLILPYKIKLCYYCRGWGKKESFPWLIRFYLKRCVDKIFCVSDSTHKNLKDFIKKKKLCYTTYTSVDLIKLDSWKKEIKGLNHEKVRLLYAGAIIPAKGVDLIIKAIGDLDDELKAKIDLRIAGDIDSHQVKDYLKFCCHLGDSQNVRIEWLGWRNDVPKLIGESDVVCLPSFSEGMPRIVQEAMYIGTTVVSTPVGGVPELIEDKSTGYIMELGNQVALKEIIHKILIDGIDPNMLALARDHVWNNFSPARQYDVFIKALEA